MAKKDFGKRLMPEYLLKYSEDLLKNHPDPSAEWGGGADYTAGYGIEISNDEISVDEEVIASKSELNGYIKDNDLNYASTFRGKGVYVKEEGTYTATSYADGSIGRSIPHQPGYTYTLPDKSGTFAMTVDIITSYNDLTDKPTIPTKTSDLTNDSGFITGVAWNDVTGKPTFATVATSGDYDDLLNKPTIPTVPSVLSAFTNDVGYITGITSSDVTTALGYTPGTSNFSGSYNDLTDKPTIPTKTSDLTNDSGFITGVAWNDVTGKPTFATVATSGSYNDLSNKPSIPEGSTNPFMRVTDANDAVFFSLTGTAGSFFKWLDVANEAPIHVNLHALNPVFGTGLTSTYNTISSQLEVAVDTTTVALKSDIPTVPTNVSAFTNDSGYITGITSAMVTAALGYTPGTSSFSGSYNDLTDKPTIPTTAASTSTSTVTPTTQTLVFTMEDDTTVTINVMTGATVSTTTTTTLS